MERAAGGLEAAGRESPWWSGQGYEREGKGKETDERKKRKEREKKEETYHN